MGEPLAPDAARHAASATGRFADTARGAALVVIERSAGEAYRATAAVEHTIEFGGDSLFDVVITTRGRADLEGVKRFGEELITDPRFRAGSTVLVDHSELDARPLTTSDLREIGRIAPELAELLGDTVFAVVVPDTFTFGLARQSATLSEPLDSAAVRIFYSRGDAEAWLREANAKKAP